jgi:hypothetical protein
MKSPKDSQLAGRPFPNIYAYLKTLTWFSITRSEIAASINSTRPASRAYALISTGSGVTLSHRSNLSLKMNNPKNPVPELQQTEPVVRKVIVVNVEPEHAFSVFTPKMGQWWQ